MQLPTLLVPSSNSHAQSLLEETEMQWLVGDWESLIQLKYEEFSNYSDRAQLAAYAAAGHWQIGNTKTAKNLVMLAKEWKVNNELLNRVVLAGAYNSLGRAKAIKGDENGAKNDFISSTHLLPIINELKESKESRTNTQIVQTYYPNIVYQLGLVPYINKQTINEALITISNNLKKAETHQQKQQFEQAQIILKANLKEQPNNLSLLAMIAENAMFREEYVEAIQYWQELIAELGAETPQSVYTQLTLAYEQVTSFGGTPEENHCWGDRHKHEILEQLHKELKPRLYLEIGVDEGISLAKAQGPAIGVDPRENLKLKVKLPPTAKIITASSDAFFKDKSNETLSEYLDLAFIDGMHLFEFALRDFINIERLSNSSTLVVIDDIHPCNLIQAKRKRESTSWTGDVWKLHTILKKYRPDLKLLDLNAHTTGLLLISGLNSKNKILEENYKQIVKEYKAIDNPPMTVLVRAGSLASNTPKLDKLTHLLIEKRKNN